MRFQRRADRRRRGQQILHQLLLGDAAGEDRPDAEPIERQGDRPCCSRRAGSSTSRYDAAAAAAVFGRKGQGEEQLPDEIEDIVGYSAREVDLLRSGHNPLTEQPGTGSCTWIVCSSPPASIATVQRNVPDLNRRAAKASMIQGEYSPIAWRSGLLRSHVDAVFRACGRPMAAARKSPLNPACTLIFLTSW